MLKRMLIIIFILGFMSINFLSAEDTMPETKEYIYVLKLIPSLIDPGNWTDKDNDIVSRHFTRLQTLLEEKVLILAGRTLNDDETTFGIVIFRAEDDASAQDLMTHDPAVKEGIMTAELFPYSVALIEK